MNDANRDKLLERAVTALEALAKIPSELKATRATIAKHSEQLRNALHGVRDQVGAVRECLLEATGLAAIGAADDDEFGDLLKDLPGDTSHVVADFANAMADDFPDLPDLGDVAGGPDAPAGDNGAADAAAGGPGAAATAIDGDANAAVGDGTVTASGTANAETVPPHAPPHPPPTPPPPPRPHQAR